MRTTCDTHEAAAHGRKARESPKGANNILWRAGKAWIPANEPLQEHILRRIMTIMEGHHGVKERPESYFYGSATGPTMVQGEAGCEPLRSVSEGTSPEDCSNPYPGNFLDLVLNLPESKDSEGERAQY